MSDPKNPAKGDRHIDASAITIIASTPDHLNTLTKLREGHKKAIDNVAGLTLAQLKAAGLNVDEVAAVVALAAEHSQIGIFHEASEKLTELLHETHRNRGHQIAIRLAELVEQARRRAERSPNGAEILGPLDELLQYQLGPAQKGAATKAKAKAKAKSAVVSDDKAAKNDGAMAP